MIVRFYGRIMRHPTPDFVSNLEFPPDSQPNQVRYQKHIEEVSFLEFIESWLGITGEEFGERLHQALLVKLDYWAYEGEFRWFRYQLHGPSS